MELSQVDPRGRTQAAHLVIKPVFVGRQTCSTLLILSKDQVFSLPVLVCLCIYKLYSTRIHGDKSVKETAQGYL